MAYSLSRRYIYFTYAISIIIFILSVYYLNYSSTVVFASHWKALPQITGFFGSIVGGACGYLLVTEANKKVIYRYTNNKFVSILSAFSFSIIFYALSMSIGWRAAEFLDFSKKLESRIGCFRIESVRKKRGAPIIQLASSLERRGLPISPNNYVLLSKRNPLSFCARVHYEINKSSLRIDVTNSLNDFGKIEVFQIK